MEDTIEIPALSEQQMRLQSGAEEGRISFDERGSAFYQLAPVELENTGHDRIPTTLDHPRLAVVEYAADSRASTANALGAGPSYDPYRRDQLAGEKTKRRLSLQELSRWIELKRKVAKNQE